MGVTIENGKLYVKLFIGSCIFMVSNLDELNSNLNDEQCKNRRFLQERQRL